MRRGYEPSLLVQQEIKSACLLRPPRGPAQAVLCPSPYSLG